MIILHLVARTEFEATPADRPFVAAHYATDGFIHCTAEWAVLRHVANNVYREAPGDFVVLELDTERITAEVRLEPPVPPPPPDHPLAGHLFPHIYGPIDRAAITMVRPIKREPDGTFIIE